jgi:hypothetical protein
MADLFSEVTLRQHGESTVEVKYNGMRLWPSPFIAFKEEPVFDDTGTRTSVNTSLTLTGTVLILPSGSYEQLYIKQTELRNIFSTDYEDFVVVAGGSNKTLPSGAVICSGIKPRVLSLTIDPDIHVTRFDYTIELEDLVAASGVSGITSSLSNQWSFREDPDTCTVEVTHSVSADGPDGEPDRFEQALRAVKPLLGIDKLPLQLPCFVEPNASGLFNITHPSNPAGGPIFEVSVQREEVADVANGSYSVTEIFRIVSGVPFYYTSKTQSYDEDQNGTATVTIAGTVQGLDRTINTSFGAEGGLGFHRAVSGFQTCIRPELPWEASGVYFKYKQSSVANNGSGLNLTSPQSISISENRCRGTVDFSFTYTDDPLAFLPSGIVSQSCNVSITNGVRVFASHAIPYRSLGNIVQDILTTSEGTISIQCQAQARNTGSPTDDTNRAIIFVQEEINRLKNQHANPADFVNIRLSNLTEDFSDVELTSNVTAEFIFTVALANVQSVSSPITLRTLS